jgi:hypothetical protein
MYTLWRDAGILTILAIAFSAIAFSLPMLCAQQRPSHSPRGLLTVLPSALDVHAAAIGNRIQVPGKERTVFSVSLVRETSEHIPLRIIVQLPNLVRLEGLRPNAAPVVFDGTNPVVANSRIEENLLEIFSSDTAEGMLVSIKDGAAATLVGRRVLEAVHSTTPPETVHRYDIFEVVGPVWSNPGSLERLKRYFFDSETGLLAKTRYLDESFSPPLNIEISFSDWRQESGSAYPGRIERKENGYPAFSLTLSSIVALPRLDPASFVHAEQQEE